MKNGNYVDGFVLVVPQKNLTAYRKMATMGKKIWRKHGALDYVECIGDDMHPDMGPYKILDFQKMTKSKNDELVVFSYIVYKSKAHRNQVNAKVMKDPAMQPDKQDDMKDMPFDMKRMAYGGFKVIVNL